MSRAPGRRTGVRAGLAAAGAVLLCACGSGGSGGSGGGTAESAPPAPSAPVTTSEAPAPPPPVTEPAEVHTVPAVLVTDDPSVTGTGGQDWAGLLAGRLAAAGTPVDLAPRAVAGAGLAGGSPSFTELVEDSVSHETQLVILFDAAGSGNASEMGAGIADALAAVERRAPDALAVVVAPMPSSGLDQPARSTLQQAALRTEVTVTFVDPVAEQWPADVDPARLAELLHPHVAPLVEMLATSGAFE